MGSRVPVVYVLAVLTVAAAAAVLMRSAASRAQVPEHTGALLAIAGPTRATLGERYALYAGVTTQVPGLRIHASVCEPGHPCRLLRSTDIAATGESWHWLGTFLAEASGDLMADVVLLAQGAGGFRSVDHLRWRIAAAEPPPRAGPSDRATTMTLTAPSPRWLASCADGGTTDPAPDPVHLTENYPYRFEACGVGTFFATISPFGADDEHAPQVAIWFAGSPVADVVVAAEIDLEVELPGAGWLTLAYVNDPASDGPGLEGMGVTLSGLEFAASP